MARRKIKKREKPEADSVYFLKIILYFIFGAIWLSFGEIEILPGINSLPVGLVVGLLFASHDHFQIDRKIEYAVLLAAAIVSYVAPIGLVIQV